MDERAVNELRQLAALDAELSGHAAAIRRLDDEVGALRARAEAIEAFFAAYAVEELRRRSELTEATGSLKGRLEQLADAGRSLEQAHDDEARLHAEHAVARARDHIAVAESTLARAQVAAAELEREAASLPGELDELTARARAVPDVRQPAGSLVAWAAHAHAGLFVAAGQTDAQRERVIREANELASMLLGEPTYGATLAQALARVEAHWTSVPGQVSESR